MRYSILILAATRRFSRCADQVKTLLQRSALLTLGTAAALAATTAANPAKANTLAALSFDLGSTQVSSAQVSSALGPGPEPVSGIGQTVEVESAPTSSLGAAALGTREALAGDDSVPYASAKGGVMQSYADGRERVLVQPVNRQPAIAIAAPQPAVARVTSALVNAMTQNNRGKMSDASPSQVGHSSAPANFQANGPVAQSQAADPIPAQWWEQGSDSPIAVAIGNAEGTRQPDGNKNAAYYWHQDPGNGADNFGTFSYQHFSSERTRSVQAEASVAGKREVAAAQSLPEIADQEQMQRLRRFYAQLQQQAADSGITLTPLEILNGLDLINQSEAAGLSKGGYIDRLVKMRALEDDVDEQIKEARSWSYWHPERKAWDAPGLGNGYANVRRDQDRRFEAVKQAMAEYIPNGASLIAQRPAAQAPVGDASNAVDSMAGNSSVATANLLPKMPFVTPENRLTTAAQIAQADTLSFGLSQVAAHLKDP
jgi:hypothetical protein